MSVVVDWMLARQSDTCSTPEFVRASEIGSLLRTQVGLVEIHYNLFCGWNRRVHVAAEHFSLWSHFGFPRILLSCIAQPKTVSVSASAALIGIMGAYLADIGMQLWIVGDGALRS